MLVFAAAFVAFAALQLNDPDPIAWTAIYLAAALATALLPSHPMGPSFALAVLAVAVPWAAVLLARVVGEIAVSDLWLDMSAKGGRVEEGREAGGLLIVAFVLVTGLTVRRLRDNPAGLTGIRRPHALWRRLRKR